eukprot:jgi/Bigna1/129844/aug1.10_g4552
MFYLVPIAVKLPQNPVQQIVAPFNLKEVPMLDVVVPVPLWVVIASSAILAYTIHLSLRPQATRDVKSTDDTLVPFKWVQRGEKKGNDEHIELLSERIPEKDMQVRARKFYEFLNMRRSLRFYSTDPIPHGVLEDCIRTAGTAPSGAHKQPWTFAIVRGKEERARIRELVEKEEKINYDRRMKKSWVNDVAVLTGEGADKRLYGSGAPKKPYLTDAPALVVLFKQVHGVDSDGKRTDNYYVQESCGIATGMFIAALHNVGLATLTSTPMGAGKAIGDLLGRPTYEKVFLLLPVGYPAKDATVPYRDAQSLRKPDTELFISK